jgi:RecA-family ATPase
MTREQQGPAGLPPRAHTNGVFCPDLPPPEAYEADSQAATPAQQTQQYLKWPELSRLPVPDRVWRLENWLTTGATLLAGGGGVGKSTLAQTIATALATNTSYIAKPTGSMPIVNLMWACEDDSDELWRRQVAICAGLNVPMSELEDLFYLESRFGCDNTLYTLAFNRPVWTSTFDLLREQVNDTHADVLWLDNLGHVFGCNENDRHLVTAFINWLVRLRLGLSVVVLGHPARGSGSEFAGSAAWENAVRTRWYFGQKLPDQDDEEDGGGDANPDVRYLCRRKANYTFRDCLRFTYRNGLFVPDESKTETFSERFGGAARNEEIDVVVLAGFDRCLAAGITPTDGRTSPDFLPTRIMAMNLNGAWGKRDLARAMNRLMGEGRLKRAVVGAYSNRTPRHGLQRT